MVLQLCFLLVFFAPRVVASSGTEPMVLSRTTASLHNLEDTVQYGLLLIPESM